MFFQAATFPAINNVRRHSSFTPNPNGTFSDPNGTFQMPSTSSGRHRNIPESGSKIFGSGSDTGPATDVGVRRVS